MMLVDYRCPRCDIPMDKHREGVVITHTSPPSAPYCKHCREEFVWKVTTEEQKRNGTLVELYAGEKNVD